MLTKRRSNYTWLKLYELVTRNCMKIKMQVSKFRYHASPRNEFLYCPDQDSIPVSQDTVIDEQSSASEHDCTSDRSAIGLSLSK